MTLLSPQDWTFPVPIAYGLGRLAEIADLCRAAGMANPLIVTDRGSRDLPFIAGTAGHLAKGGLASAVFAGISPNPRDTEVAEGAAAYRAGGHDGIIGIGGGSGMDGAKAVALTAESGTPLWDFEFRQAVPRVETPFPPMILIPTTSGTGAETEGTGMVTDTAQGMKFCVWHPALKPAFALLDPELTLGLPRNLTAWTGLDALTHAIEAYSVPGFHPLCDGAALEALRLIWRWLPEAVEEPGSLEARAGMLVGSCLAGVAFLKGLGIVHAVSHMVGAEYETHHGLTNAVLLPAALRFNAPALGATAGPMAEAIGIEGRGPKDIRAAVATLLDRFEIPASLGALGVPEDAAPRLAAKAVQDSGAGTNARVATLAEMEAFIAEATTAAR